MAKSKKGQKKSEENGQEVLDQEITNEAHAEEQPNKAAETKEEKSELDQLKDEVEEQKDKYLRLYSEFDNYRRRTAKEKLELTKTANEELVVALLPVVDDFERAQKAAEDDSEKEGIALIYNKLVNVLQQKGVKEIETNKGDDFNDEVHEAITQIPAPEEGLKGKIVDVVEKGYYLDEKVVRFAKVVTGA